MVKNTVGGKKGKMYASKNVMNSSKNLRLSTNSSELYVCVTKVLGSGMFEVVDNENVKYKAILRGKMKGPNKRFNLVSIFSILLVGLRLDSSDSSLCDILFVYDANDIRAISLLPSCNISKIIYLHHYHSFPSVIHSSNDLFSFQNDSFDTTISPSSISIPTQIHTDNDSFDFDFI